MKPGVMSILTDGECDALADAALRILQEFGVLVTQPEATDLLVGAGARRGDDGRIRMDAATVRGLVAKAPSHFKLHDRRGGSIEVGSGRCWTMCGGTVSRVAQWPGWSLRSATRHDVVRFARLCDALPLVHCVVPVVEAQDVGAARAEAVTFMETLANTTKFVIACPVQHASARAFVEMGRIATGRDDLLAEPKIGLLATVLPSLHLDDDCAATTVLAAAEGLPLVAMAGTIAGSSCPNTVASAVASKTAGELFLVALAQIVRPGTPVLIDCGAVILDMRTADIGEAGPEYPLGVAAMSQMARGFRLPTYSCALHCEAKTGDFQAGLEKMAGMMTCLLAGVDLTTNIGMVSRCSAASYEQMILDHELCAFLERFGRGVDVSGDTLALDVLREVGPGGAFLSHEHTRRHCRSGEIWYPALLDRSSVGTEGRDLYDEAHSRAEEILATHASPLRDDVRKALASYVEELPE